MTSQIVPWRTLGMLTVGVLLAHALVLQTHPARFGPQQDAASTRVPALITRSIPAMPAAEISPQPVVTAAPAKAKPTVKTVKKPAFRKKVPVAQLAPEPAALNAIAEPIQEPVISEVLPADSTPALPTTETTPASTADTDTATAATPPASAAAALSPPPPPQPQPEQTPVTAMALPASAQLEYQMSGSAKGLTYHAKGEMAWQNTGGSYHASMTVKALFIGARTMRSTGQVSAQGLAPSRFTDKSRSEVAAHFEPDKGQISFSANTPAVAWVQGAQDRVSVFMQLAGMLAGNPAGFPVGSTISTLTVGPRGADNWTFRVEGEEILSLPLGEMATLKLSRQPRREYDQKVEIWYAPALGYLPVRNKITQANGDFVDQQLSALARP